MVEELLGILGIVGDMRSIDPKFQALRGLSLFHGVDDRDLLDLARSSDETTLRAAERIIVAGGLNRHAYVVLDGELEVLVGDEVVATVGPGGIVGERSALTHEAANATVIAATRTTVIIVEHRRLLGASSIAPRLRARLESLVDRRDDELTTAA